MKQGVKASLKQGVKASSSGERLLSSLMQEFKPSRLLANLTASFVSGVVGVMVSVSFAALIFAGDLASHLSAGVGIALFSAVVLRTAIALTSSLPGVIADTDALPSAILAISAVSIQAQMPAATDDQVFLTVVCAIALTSLLTGAFLLLLGLFKVGELIRFIPYPVVGGFIAGTGWLLAKGSVQVMTDLALSPAQLPMLLQPDVLIRWLSGSVFAVVLVLVSRRYTHYLVLPICLLSGVGLFYGALLLTQTSLVEATTQGWFLGPFDEEGLWQPLSPTALTQADWPAILGELGNIATILLVSPILILLTASGLELTVEKDIDLNRELQSAGIANLLSGLGGGMVGYHTFSDSVLAYRMGARSRLTGIFTALLCGVALLGGTKLLSFFPKPILGGLLLFLGLSLLVEWLYDARFKLPRLDYLVVLLILLVISAIGFLEGVGIGLVAAIVLFVVNYSRINVTKHIFSGENYQSNIARPPHQAEFLKEKGRQIYILELQGFIFFGTADRLLNQIRQHIHSPGSSALRFVVMDFRLVSGLDSSAVVSFIKLRQIAHKQGFILVFTSLQSTVQNVLYQGECLKTGECQIVPNLNQGVEWCENQVLEAASWRRGRVLPMALRLQRSFSDPDQVAAFMGYLDRFQIQPGDYLFQQGSEAEFLYFVESGQIITVLEGRAALEGRAVLEGGEAPAQIQMGAGTMAGELAFYTQSLYQTSAIATQISILYRLSFQSLKKMQQENPQTATTFQELTISLLSNRLTQACKEIENLRS